MRHIFIINPSAGRKNSAHKLLERVDAVFSPGEYEAAYTAGEGDARALAERAVALGEPQVAFFKGAPFLTRFLENS